MATEITCIVPDSSDPGGRIDAVGGSGWQKDEDTVIAEIENGTETYYTNAAGQRADVVVMTDRTPKYLRTDADETNKNNLLELPSCP
jgi:ethanolamine utilization microcompartment shell protein EutL